MVLHLLVRRRPLLQDAAAELGPVLGLIARPPAEAKEALGGGHRVTDQEDERDGAVLQVPPQRQGVDLLDHDLLVRHAERRPLLRKLRDLLAKRGVPLEGVLGRAAVRFGRLRVAVDLKHRVGVSGVVVPARERFAEVQRVIGLADELHDPARPASRHRQDHHGSPGPTATQNAAKAGNSPPF